MNILNVSFIIHHESQYFTHFVFTHNIWVVKLKLYQNTINEYFIPLNTPYVMSINISV